MALFCWGLGLTCSNAQVGMPTNNPNKDAVLDLNRTDGTSAKGLLLPKVVLTGLANATPMTAHVAGMHVWNTATGGSGATAFSPGEYFNNGSKWVRVSSAADSWIQDGNYNGVIKAIGTNDNFDLPIETNGTEKLRVTSGGQLLINTTTSLAGGTNAKLQINSATSGALQIKDGTQALNKILTSDANGLATWQLPAMDIYTGVLAGPSGITIYANDLNFTNTGNYVDLPPGKWMINVNFLIYTSNGFTAADESWHIRSSFTEKTSMVRNSITTSDFSANIVGGALITGEIGACSIYGHVRGSIIINNPGSVSKRYYYIAGSPQCRGVSVSSNSIKNFAADTTVYSDGVISYQKMN